MSFRVEPIAEEGLNIYLNVLEDVWSFDISMIQVIFNIFQTDINFPSSVS